MPQSASSASSSIFMESSDDTGLTQITGEGSSPCLKAGWLATWFQAQPLPCDLTYSHIWGWGCRHCKEQYSACHSSLAFQLLMRLPAEELVRRSELEEREGWVWWSWFSAYCAPLLRRPHHSVKAWALLSGPSPSWDSAWAPHCCLLLFHQCRGIDTSSPLLSAPTCLTTLGGTLNHPCNSVNNPPIKSSSVPPLGMASAACQAHGWWIEETSSMARSFPTSHLAKSTE